MLEDQEFDELTKKLARPVSRRTAVKAAVATAVGGVFALGKLTGAGAAFSTTCKCNGQPCYVNGQCCSGACGLPGQSGLRTCTCPGGTTACQGQNSYANCVPNCTGGQVLDANTCTCGCPTGTTSCFNGSTTTCLACTGGAVPGPSCTGCVCPTGTTTCTYGGTTSCLACGAGTIPNTTCTACINPAACGSTICATGQTCANPTTGTCGRTCSIFGSACPGGNSACTCRRDVRGGGLTSAAVCGLGQSACVYTQCTTSADCPAGSFCDYYNSCPNGQCVATC